MSYKLKSNELTSMGGLMEPPGEDLGLISLEPRILLDAAGFVTGAEVAMDTLVAEGAQQGVEAIFGNDAIADTPRGGPWLGEVAETPRGGPWLGEVAETPRGGPWLGNLA